MILDLKKTSEVNLQIATGSSKAVSSLVLMLAPVLAGVAGDTVSEQSITASTSETVTHNLGRNPFVQVIDNAGHVVDANIQHISTNQFVVYFNVPVTGKILII